MKELCASEVELVSGGDGMTYTWGVMVGQAARSAWNAMKEYAASPDSSTDVIV